MRGARRTAHGFKALAVSAGSIGGATPPSPGREGWQLQWCRRAPRGQLCSRRRMYRYELQPPAPDPDRFARRRSAHVDPRTPYPHVPVKYPPRNKLRSAGALRLLESIAEGRWRRTHVAARVGRRQYRGIHGSSAGGRPRHTVPSADAAPFLAVVSCFPDAVRGAWLAAASKIWVCSPLLPPRPANHAEEIHWGRQGCLSIHTRPAFLASPSMGCSSPSCTEYVHAHKLL